MKNKSIHTEIRIHASAEKIWNILMDFESYPQWNSFIPNINGQTGVGQKMKVKIHPPQGSAMIFKPQVVTHVPQKEFSWQGKLFVKGLFDGQHTFELQSNADGSITFIQREVFQGIFVGMFNTHKTEMGFKAMNEALKARAEKKV